MSSDISSTPVDEDAPLEQAVDNLGPLEPAFLDLASMFIYSGLLDNVRDSALALLSAGKGGASSSSDATFKLTKSYQKLSARFSSMVREDLREDLSDWTDTLDSASGLQDIYVATSKLARWIDLQHNVAKFVLSQHIADAEAMMATQAMEAKLGKSGIRSDSRGLSQGVPSSPSDRRVGFQLSPPTSSEAKTGFYM